MCRVINLAWWILLAILVVLFVVVLVVVVLVLVVVLLVVVAVVAVGFLERIPRPFDSDNWSAEY